MKRDTWIPVVIVLFALLFALCASSSVGAQGGEDGVGVQALMGTSFTYQGHLVDDGGPAEGSYDLRFILYDASAGGSQVGSTVTQEDVAVSDGKFTVQLDFGAAAFAGQARWLEVAVRPGSSTGGYTTLSPRQALTPAPYVLYAARAPWGGLLNVPAGLDDGDDDTTYTAGRGLTLSGTEFSADTAYLQRRVSGTCAAGSSIQTIGADGAVTCEADDNTTYSAGTGLTLVGTQFRANFGGSGSAGTVARSDHNHLGQTWSGTNNPLTIGGSFGSPGYAPLLLSNSSSSGDGLRVSSAGDDGVQVSSAGGDGLFVDVAGDDGLEVNAPEDDGVRVTSSGGDGVDIWYTNQYGININEANWAAIRVALTDASALYAEDVGWGVYVDSATNYGVNARGNVAGGYFADPDSGTYTYVAYGNYGVYSNRTKNFVQEHPTDPSKVIIYASLEGGEAGTYYRGTARLTGGTATVELPEHFSLVTEEEGLTVQVTPREDCNGLYVSEVTTRAIVVKELMGGTSDARFDFTINGVRAGYAEYEVIRDAAEALPQEVMSSERAKTGQ